MCAFLKKEWVILLIAIPYFFCMNNYLGIQIDGALYTLQVIHRWFPERFVGDPPFMFGNQDSFTIFSPIYGFLMSHLPVDVAAMVVTFVMHLVFAVAMILFIRAFARKFNFEHWTLPLAIAFFTIYISGSDRTFIFFSRLIEPYPVPRSLAVAFGIMGLAAIFSKNRWITPVLALVGSAFHPLMAGWVLPVWMFYHFPKTRIPIVLMSALFPLAGYIGVEPFAGYPDDWYYKPLTYGPNAGFVFRFLMYIAFFIIFIKRYAKGAFERQFCFSVLLITAIATYWYLWTGINNFILLYQFQVWRMEWLCIVTTFILFAYVLYDVVSGYRETRRFTTRDLAVVLIGLTLFSDIHAPEGLIAAIILLLKKNENVTKKHFLMLGFMYAVLNLLMAAYCYMLALDASVPYIVNFLLANSLYNRYIIITALVCLICGLLMLRKKDFFRAVLFLLYPFFPQLLLLPIVALAIPLLKRWQVVAAIVLIIIDGVWGFPMRTTNISLTLLEKSQFLWAVLFVSVFVIAWFAKVKYGLVAKILLFLPVLFAVPYAMTHWDHRQEKQKIEESNLDQFKSHMAFPQVKERGKVFYYVNGYMNGDSRLQFLGGNYVDTKTTVGEIFNKGHHQLAVDRLNRLIYKNDNKPTFKGVYERARIMYDFFEDSLSISGILIDRTKYLCSLDEISHLVSDFENLPFVKQDSLWMNVLDKNVYLYECPQLSQVEVESN